MYGHIRRSPAKENSVPKIFAKVNREEIARGRGWRKSANVPSLTLLVASGLDSRVPLHPAVGFFGLMVKLVSEDTNKMLKSYWHYISFIHKLKFLVTPFYIC
jgi:hypothetical protein